MEKERSESMSSSDVGLTVACCVWGEFPETGWSEEYVRRLRNGVSRNLAQPHRFICFADRQLKLDDIEVRKLNPPQWKGNLPKTYLYSPEAGLTGRVICFDLDNVIVGDLSDIAAYNGPLCVRGRRRQDGLPNQPDGDILSFDAGKVQHLWEKANNPKLAKLTQGREREFILLAAPDCDQWQDVCPGQIVSYRYHCRAGLPQGARIVSMHGRVRQHQVADSFIVENWR
jgi:hypothetical protein